MTTIERLQAELATLTEQRDTLDRRVHEVRAALSECQGDTLDAEWHRACAAGDHEKSHALWVRVMARTYVRSGMEPVSADDRRDIAEIRAEVERLKAGVKP